MLEKIECAPYNATLSKAFCAGSHEKSNSKEGMALMQRQKCRRCEVGAACLGTDKYLERSVLFRSKICARCQRQSIRLVGGWRCVSCYNREGENMRGLNKHGNPLKLIRYYYKAEVTFITRDGEMKMREFQKVLNEGESAHAIKLTEPDFISIKSIVLTPIQPPATTKKRKITG